MRSVLCLFVYGIFSVGFAIPARSETLTLAEAIQRALQSFPTLEIQQQIIKESEGARIDAGLLPNPGVSYSREDLSQLGLTGGEWMVSTSLPLTSLWTRGPEIRAATAQVQAEIFAFDHLQKQVRFNVQKAFVEYHYAREKHRAWQKVSALFQEASRTGNIRQAEGDISTYEQHRIALEALHYARLETESRMELNQYLRTLTFYIHGQQPEADIETVLDIPAVGQDDPLYASIDQATVHRSDIQMTKAFVDVSKATWAAVRRKGLPETDVSFGFKRQTDGFDGVVFEVAMDLSVFNRNQGKVKTAQATYERQRLTLALLQQQVQQEVATALDRCRLYGDQIKRMEQLQASSETILEIAKFSYLEGEMSLVEMLDGLRAYSEAFQARLDLLSAYQISQFELEKAIGHSLSELKQRSQNR